MSRAFSLIFAAVIAAAALFAAVTLAKADAAGANLSARACVERICAVILF